MKKSLFVSAILLTSLVVLGGCGNSNASSESKLKAENSSLKQEVKSMKQKLKDERNTKVTAAIEEAGGDASDVSSDDSSSSSDSNKKYAKATVGEEYVFKNKKVSTRTLYQPDFKQKRQIIPDTGSRPAGIICRSLYAH